MLEAEMPWRRRNRSRGHDRKPGRNRSRRLLERLRTSASKNFFEELEELRSWATLVSVVSTLKWSELRSCVWKRQETRRTAVSSLRNWLSFMKGWQLRCKKRNPLPRWIDCHALCWGEWCWENNPIGKPAHRETKQVRRTHVVADTCRQCSPAHEWGRQGRSSCDRSRPIQPWFSLMVWNVLWLKASWYSYDWLCFVAFTK